MIRSGAATIRMDHKSYVADIALYDGTAVTFTGRLRATDLAGARLYRPVTMTIPVARVDSITWHETA
jgi:hypothetical protein